jgi:hypothetical protein
VSKARDDGRKVALEFRPGAGEQIAVFETAELRDHLSDLVDAELIITPSRPLPAQPAPGSIIPGVELLTAPFHGLP